MNRAQRTWLLVGGLSLAGYLGWQLVRGVSAAVRPAKAAARDVVRLDLGPYPFSVQTAPNPVTDPGWYDPAATVKRVADENAKVPRLKAALHKETTGDGARAIEVLLPKCKEPDAAQALLEIMNEIVPKLAAPESAAPEPAAPEPAAPKPAAVKAEETRPATVPAKSPGPVFSAEPSEALHAIAKVADTLKARYASKEMGHFDQILLERAILLLGFHGAPDLPGAVKARQTDGKEVPSIDPVTRATLRGLLQVEGAPQVLAARALGQLGDLQTAREIIEQPGKYPGASIADFGPKAVDEFKQARLKQLQQGVEGFDNMVQGMRLTPKYQDVAIDLAMAGDAGAGMAMQRNFALELAQLDTDEVLARRIDTALRFPGTRQAKAVRFGLVFGNFDPFYKKTTAMILKAMDHYLRIVFGSRDWTDDQLTVLWSETGMGMFGYLWHYRELLRGTRGWEGWDLFYEQLEALFRKHYRKETFPAFGSGTPVTDLSLYARHLGLPAIARPGGGGWNQSRWDVEIEYARHPGPDGKIRMEDMHFMYAPNPGQCYHAGHIKGREDF